MALSNPALPYLPLLAHPHPDVRQHAAVLLWSIHGLRGFTYLRRLLNDDNRLVRQQAATALETVAQATGKDARIEAYDSLYIACLGHFQIHVGNRELQPQEWLEHNRSRAGWQKIQAVLAYLVHCGSQGTTRAALAQAVWGRSATATSLSRVLSALRQTLVELMDETRVDQLLTTNTDYCALNPEWYHTDAAMLERSFAIAVHCEQIEALAAAMPLYRQVLDMYGGPYLADVLPSARWGRVRREQLQHCFATAAERVVAHSYSQQHFNECIVIAQRVLDFDETVAETTIWLLRAYQQLGLRADLEYSYRRYLDALRNSPRGATEADAVTRAYAKMNERSLS